MIIRKIILASCILLAGCSSTPDDEYIYDEEMPLVGDMQIAPDNERRVIQYIPKATDSKNNNDQAPRRKNDVFTVLDRNSNQVSRLYVETTKKIYLSDPEPEEVEEEEPEEVAVEEEEAPVEHKDYTADCITYCGEGYFYSHDGEKLNGYEHICLKYPLPCGEECRKDWYIQELIYDTNYTCQEAIQKETDDEPVKAEPEKKAEPTEAKK